MEAIAAIPILYRGKQYKEGESLPVDDAEMVKLWKEAGSIVIVSEEESPEVKESENPEEENPEVKESENPEEENPEESEEVAPVQPENESGVVVSESKAIPETAEPGLEGLAVNGETEENMVGKVPKTAARKKK